MKELVEALKSMPKEFLSAIILELMISEKVSYEDITKVYVEYLDTLRKGQSEAYLELQSKVVAMWSGNKKRPRQESERHHALLA